MRYRLRTLLIAITVFACVFGVLYYRTRPMLIYRTNPDTGKEYVTELRYTLTGRMQETVLTPDTLPKEHRPPR